MIGRQLGHYTITAHLGTGGMGEVYQATDTKLSRSVALKFLPQAFANDLDSTTRFRREAQTLAALNHPRIATVHGLEEADSRNFIVMEFVPGQTLAERIGRRPLPLHETLAIARQIAEALEAAHEKGIVHRDLKPANVKITPDGQVKVLDFGLAKSEGHLTNTTDTATTFVSATNEGVVLGTAPYMAPEQAKGLPVDRRADIFAFGCILYEMLTGYRAFEGENAADVLSRVLQREPNWTRIPSDVPPLIHRLLRLCLEKDPAKRRQAAGDVRIDLDDAMSAPPEALPSSIGRSSRSLRALWVTGALLLLALGANAVKNYSRPTPSYEVRLDIVTPAALDPLDFALSPDGRYIVFAALTKAPGSPQGLYLRSRDKAEAQLLAATEGARFPFWSPDSRSIGFFAAGKLFRMDLAGGPPQRLASAGVPLGGTWNADGTILFAPNTVSPLFRVSATGGGKATPATQLDPLQNSHRQPSFLPDGHNFLFYAPGDPEVSGIYLGSLNGAPPKRLTPANSPGIFLPPDRLVYLQEGSLVARKLDASKSELTGDPVTLASPIGNDAITGFSVAEDGTIAYRSGSSTPRFLTWFDHTGKITERFEDMNGPDLSTDGKRVVFDRTVKGNRDVWLLDLLSGGLIPFTFHSKVDGYPLWSPDGKRIAFESNRNGNFDLWIKQTDGAADTEQLLYGTADNEWPLDWSNDGRYLLYSKTDSYYVASDLLALPMTGENRKPIVIASTAAEERRGEFSPDGRWVAYDTDESGRSEILIQAFPESKGIVHISTTGGASPRWRADGKELYFVGPFGEMMSVSVATSESTVKHGKPVQLFSTRITSQTFKSQYTVAPDGRFLILNHQEPEPSPSPIHLILNWKP